MLAEHIERNRHIMQVVPLECLDCQARIAMSVPLEIVGTWEEVSQHASELSGCIVRVTVLGEKGRQRGLSKGRSDRSQAARLPDPPCEAGERPIPFDLPRPGVGVRVAFQEGRIRLPDPPTCLPE
jgi:hypothetical protein